MSVILLKNIVLDGKTVDIYIEGGHFSKIVPAGSPAGEDGSASVLPEVTETVDCSGKAAVPGFVNMHTHAAMSLMRGVGEDIHFQDWIKRIWKVEKGVDGEYVYWATKAACVEMIKTGTTAYNDHYWYPLMGHKAGVEMGLRPAVSLVAIDHNNPSETGRQKEECMALYEDSLSWEHSMMVVAFHAIYSVSEELMLWCSDFARKHGLKLHIHLSETEGEVVECMKQHGGLSPVQYLDRLGILGPEVLAAHTLWLSDEDVRILGERKVNCVHNINSNLKLSSGYRFRYNELRDAGANVCIGTDGCASSNNLDMLETMKTSAMVQKAWRGDPSAMPLDELMAMATVNGGRALGLNVGRIEEGALADMLIVDTDSVAFISPGSFLANLVYSAHSDCIDSLICGGRFLMRGRRVEGEHEIMEEARRVLRRIG